MEIVFKKSLKEPDALFIDGMTLNERLFHFDLFNEFDAAVRSKQFLAIRQVLFKVKVPEKQAQEIAEALLASPKKYGFLSDPYQPDVA
jgi:hypothetical protein